MIGDRYEMRVTRPRGPGRSGRVATRVVLLALASLLPALLAPTAARAQQKVPPLKREVPPPRAMTCRDVAPPAPARASANAAEAQKQESVGMQAALVGNLTAAETALSRARALDPTEPRIAYELGRVLEQLGRKKDAVTAFCHYLSLAPDAPDSADVQRRIRALAPLVPTVTPAATRAFHDGLAFYDAGEYARAVVAFDSAGRAEPSWSAPFYDRALALAATGDRTTAARELQAYLARPGTESDSAAVRYMMGMLLTPPRRRFSPPLALVSGLVVPGLGQVYTGRPGFGALVAATAGGALYLALDRRATGFNEPGFWPYRVAGIATAAVVAVLGAVEATVYASHARTSPRMSPTPAIPPSPRRLRRPSVHLLRLQPSPDGIAISLVDIRLP